MIAWPTAASSSAWKRTASSACFRGRDVDDNDADADPFLVELHWVVARQVAAAETRRCRALHLDVDHRLASRQDAAVQLAKLRPQRGHHIGDQPAALLGGG